MFEMHSVLGVTALSVQRRGGRAHSRGRTLHTRWMPMSHSLTALPCDGDDEDDDLILALLPEPQKKHFYGVQKHTHTPPDTHTHTRARSWSERQEREGERDWSEGKARREGEVGGSNLCSSAIFGYLKTIAGENGTREERTRAGTQSRSGDNVCNGDHSFSRTAALAL